MEFRKLRPDEVEVKIKQVTKTGGICLLYKNARTDADILDETFGQFGWKKSYEEIKGNLYCTISVWDADKKEWVGKSDCGIESKQDDGNEIKAEASDAMKRAAFAWGIGRELYSAPFVFIPFKTIIDDRGKYKADGYHTFRVSEIEYTGRKITKLVICEENDPVFVFPGNAVPTGDALEKQIDPDNRRELLKNEILALSNDMTRISSFCQRKFGKGLNDLDGKELVEVKLAVLKGMGNGHKSNTTETGA